MPMTKREIDAAALSGIHVNQEGILYIKVEIIIGTMTPMSSIAIKYIFICEDPFFFGVGVFGVGVEFMVTF